MSSSEGGSESDKCKKTADAAGGGKNSQVVRAGVLRRGFQAK